MSSCCPQVAGRWTLGLTLCLVWTGSDVVLSTTSIMHLCAIALYRYRGIAHPLRVRGGAQDARAVLALVAPAWTIAVTLSVPFAVQGVLDSSHVLIRQDAWAAEDSHAHGDFVRGGVSSHAGAAFSGVGGGGGGGDASEEEVGGLYSCGLFNRTFAVYSSLVSFFIPLAVMVIADIRSIQILRNNIKIPHGLGERDETGGRRRSGAGRDSCAVSDGMSTTRGPQLGTVVSDCATTSERGGCTPEVAAQIFSGYDNVATGERRSPACGEKFRYPDTRTATTVASLTAEMGREMRASLTPSPVSYEPEEASFDLSSTSRLHRLQSTSAAEVGFASEMSLLGAPRCQGTARLLPSPDPQTTCSIGSSAGRHVLCMASCSSIDCQQACDRSSSLNRPVCRASLRREALIHNNDSVGDTDEMETSLGCSTTLSRPSHTASRFRVRDQGDASRAPENFTVDDRPRRRGSGDDGDLRGVRQSAAVVTHRHSTPRGGSSGSGSYAYGSRSRSRSVIYIRMLASGGGAGGVAGTKVNSRERRAERTLIWVFVAFVVLWLPFFCANLAYGLCAECNIPADVFVAFTWLGYLSSGVNPCIYTYLNRDFRNAFRNILTCRRVGRAARIPRQYS